MDTTADKLVGRVERAVALETEPVARAEAAIHTVLTTFAGHRTMARLLFLDTMGAGRVFQAETNALHARFAALIQGYLDDAVAGGRGPAARHAAHGDRLVRGDQRGRRRAGCSPTTRRGSRTRTPASARRCCAPPACRRRGSARCRCPARAGRFRRSAMTATRDARTGLGAGVGERLAALFAASGSTAVTASLASATVVAPSLDPDRALRRGRRGRTSRPRSGCGRRRASAFVGIGRAWAVEAAGAGPVPRGRGGLARAARRAPVSTGRPTRRRGAGPVLLGGDGVHRPRARGGRRVGDRSAPSSLVLPELLLTVTPARRVRDRVARRRRGRRRAPPRDALGAARRPGPGAAAEPQRHRRDAGVRAARASATSSRATTSGGGWSGCTRAPSAGAGSTRSCWLGGSASGRRSSSTCRTRCAASPRARPESTTYAYRRDGRTFLGATPERLVRTEGRTFRTVAVAGTIRRGADAAEDARARPAAAGLREGPRGAR